MIVCSCNIITRQEIEAVIRDFLHSDEWQLITPAMVYHAMTKRGKCCGCFPGVIDIIITTTQEHHRENENLTADVTAHLDAILAEHRKSEKMREQARKAKLKIIAA